MMRRLVNDDITDGVVAEVMRGERADVIYSDPPGALEGLG